MTENELIETCPATPPPGWTLGHATINLRGDKRQAIECLRRGPFAVHEVDYVNIRCWRLSHAVAGLYIWTFETQEEAVELAERIEAFTDWGQIKEMIPSGADLFHRVQAVIDEIETRDLH